METGLDPVKVAAALYVSIGLFTRRLRRTPVQDELTMPEMSALERLDRRGPRRRAGWRVPSRSPRRQWG